MVLVCLSAEAGHYRIESDDGQTLAAPYYSVAEPATAAQRLADTQHERVTLKLTDARGRETQSLIFVPTARRS